MPHSRTLPVLPLRDVVVFPHMVIPLFVGRDKSVRALEAAMAADKKLLLVAQKSASEESPRSESEVYGVGTLANILQLLRLPDGTVKVLVEGKQRIEVLNFDVTASFYQATVAEMGESGPIRGDAQGMIKAVLSQFEEYLKLNKKIPAEVLTTLEGIHEVGRLIDSAAAHMELDIDAKQRLLEIVDIEQRFSELLDLIEQELDKLQMVKRIHGRTRKQMEKSQREYYLNEQIKAIQKELGDLDEGGTSEVEEFQEKIEKGGLSDEAKKRANSELNKLKMMAPMSAEATVVRNYLDTLVSLPWRKKTKVRHDLNRAEAILDEDHYGLEKVKERILEYLAVQQRVKRLKGPILCLVGPPGVGKTSLGESIARATNRKFVRMALGGVRDESEIRGHRRTYIGSMPGKIIHNLTKVGTRNPLFLLDEIDKMSADFRGDPASALLEVLDPEQNHTFSDHYLEIDYDLSDVMFIATSNSMKIPAPLLDRMEVIRLAGYTEDEKLNIARRYLIPKEQQANGLKQGEMEITDEAVMAVIRHYTREAGVRNLQRELAKLCRKVVRRVLQQKSSETAVIAVADLEEYLGVKRHRYGLADEHDQIGQVTGLAWTEVGGELLRIETAVMPGKGKHTITGQLGDVMKESIQAAISVVRSRAAALGIAADFYENRDIHIHVPEGAIPKDGPSAGIGMCTALISALAGITVKADVAMTGEITLRGEVLPIGGLKEKLLAAHRGGIKTVIIPEENRRNLKDVPDNVKGSLTITPVRWIDEVIRLALTREPIPLDDIDMAVQEGAEMTRREHASLPIQTH
ncbi:endopeptidase La [Ectothiorhodospiraceae bacterium BW-2]|nr:endopeptidase La [Ectothiorhodospiraceae bacterium BW-2]